MPRTILLLDLDNTVFTSRVESNNIIYWHGSAEKGEYIKLNSTVPGVAMNVRIIKPDLLSDLIEHACTNHDGIMIMTAGNWDETSVKNMLVNYLDVSEKSIAMIMQSVFLNRDNSKLHFPTLTSKDIAELDKNIRLDAFRLHNPAYNKTKFVFVDDHEDHLESFIDDTNVLPVHATTRIDDHMWYGYDPSEAADFYHHAKLALDYAGTLEQEDKNSTSLILSKIAKTEPLTTPANKNSQPLIDDKTTKKRKAEDEVTLIQTKQMRVSTQTKSPSPLACTESLDDLDESIESTKRSRSNYHYF